MKKKIRGIVLICVDIVCSILMNITVSESVFGPSMTSFLKTFFFVVAIILSLFLILCVIGLIIENNYNKIKDSKKENIVDNSKDNKE